eukprot:3870153-Pleurochrysis_carterae.AAC.2
MQSRRGLRDRSCKLSYTLRSEGTRNEAKVSVMIHQRPAVGRHRCREDSAVNTVTMKGLPVPARAMAQKPI